MSSSLLHIVLRHAEGLSAGATGNSDGELLRRFAGTHDEPAFEELLHRHGPMVWAVCRQSLMDEADVEDAFQATFLALIRSAGSVRHGDAIAGWLYGVAVKVVLKLKRSAARRKTHEHRAAGSEVDRSVAESNWDSLLAAVHEEIEQLPDAMRTAFVLCELEGVRQPEAAMQLGWKPGTLTSRLTRARQLLIARLSRRGLALAGGSVGLGLATASAAVPKALLDKSLLLIRAGESVSPAIVKLVSGVTPMMAVRTKLAAAGLLAAMAFGAALFPAPGTSAPVETSAAHAPVVALAVDDAPKPVNVTQYIPGDAAFFVHVDLAKAWNGPLIKSLRDADAQTFSGLCDASKKLFGVTPDAIQSLAFYVQNLKQGPQALGLIVVFKEPYDKAKLKAGFDELGAKGDQTTLESPSNRVAILLANLDPATYAKPQKADKADPLAEAIREAASGKHLIVAGSALASLPDELRADGIPEVFRAFQPIFRADAVTAIVDLDKELKVELRVKAATAAKAHEAEKSLGALSEYMQESIGEGLAAIGKGSDKEPAVKEIVKLMTALRTGLKEAKYGTDGTVARVSARVPGDLPFAMALLAAKQKAGDAAARSRSANNLKQIAIAIHNYADVHGTLPPAAVCDKAGKPILSWRVLVLPYLEQQMLYKEFKLDEPWDSDHNKKLIARMPVTYQLPAAMPAKATETHYRVFVGNGAAFEYIKGAKFADFTDGTSNTILVATAKDGVTWTKPDELEFDPDKDMTKLLGFLQGNVCNVSFADGSVRALSKSISKKTLHGAITKGGGEVFNFDE
jgi:RNA polymerase sigma factor (sigma-70 family)